MLMKTSITFYRGIETIGGIIFEVKYGNESFICDFGKTMNHPLVSSDIHLTKQDMVDIGFIPHIDSLNDKERCVAVGISHMHLDHMGLLDYLPGNINIYMTEASKKLYEQLIYIHEEVGTNIKNTSGVRYDTRVQVTPNISATFLPVNHDVVGAASILIETPDGTICFSGDVRLNKEDMKTARWIEEVRHVDYLILETTGFFERKEYVASADVVENIDNSELLNGVDFDAHDIFIFNTYIRDVERMQYIVRFAREHNMPLVFEKQTARLIENYLDDTEKENVYYYETVSQNTPRTIQKICMSDLREMDAFFIQNSFVNIAKLREIDLSRATYLHLNGVPLGPFDPNYEIMLNWLEFLGLEISHPGSSGHAEGPQIQYMLDTIAPKAFTGVHGFNPDLLQGENHFIPEYGVEYGFDEIVGR